MKYRFTRFWACFQIALGVAVTLLGVGLGAVEFFRDPLHLWSGLPVPIDIGVARAAGSVTLAVLGFVMGGPLIVIGQLMLVFLDQRRLLARINARLERWERELVERQAGAPLGRRLRPGS